MSSNLEGVALTVAGGFAAGLITWAGRTLVEVRDSMRKVVQKLWGAPEDNGKDGLIAAVEATGAAVEAIAKAQSSLAARMKAIERTCVAVHGDVIVRDMES